MILLQRYPIQVESPVTVCLESLMFATVFEVHINLSYRNTSHSAV